MLCTRIRTALSARLDGEELPPGLTVHRLETHLAGCRDCRRWEAQIRALATGALGAPGQPEDDPAAADALLARLRTVSVRPGAVPPGGVDSGGKRAG
ncbi:zf-HC2 domain-containing protein [Streptomyces kronopolitis]|uniref:zf-HC2 domain-containing protein n=1 Tax=Streptomyces kronopolitis TaxID=1612435 RepID=UPI0020C005BD|nr:zf-HC2 domain-containing protein [Streptomyces kronopolitis]MCL6298168.1 zf-HC2 domain-containing protein [Streptomyces kronopolitis]